jgi:CHAT domain-containing protein
MDRGEAVEPESYLDVAVTKWLPRRWENADYERALEALASRFDERHSDRWLHDMLAAKRSERLTAGLAALAEAVSANLADESDRALTKSSEAAGELQTAGSQAGALRAKFEQTYALHRSVTSAAECVEKAVTVGRQAEAMKYSWIQGQAILEQGNCRSLLGDSGGAHRDMARALVLVAGAGYGGLELRAAGILAYAQTAAGNLSAAWSLGRAGLAKFWGGPYSGVRGQQIYDNLVLSSESLGLHWTAYVFERAAAIAIAETPRRRIEATVRAHLAGLAVDAGMPGEAKTEFDRAGKLFDQLRQASDQEYRILAELSHAQAELAAGAPEAAVRRLEAIQPSAEGVDAALVRIRLQHTLGDSLRRTAMPEEAEIAYRQAIALSEHRLDTLRGFRERAQLMLVAGKSYRGLVELLCDRSDLEGALRLWEWFRDGERPGRRSGPDLDQRRTRLRNESFLTYALLPGGAVVWLFDDRGVEGRRLNVNQEELETVASRFLRECAEPLSDRQTVRRDARQLYDWLVAPIADRLDPARTLVVEPDGAIGAVPMQALMDENLQYLGERFAITIAGGLADYQHRAAAGPVTAGVKALVVANPALGDEATRTFPPLAGTMPEGRSVAGRFRGSVLLTGEHATLRAVEEYRPGIELFHFAGHGFSNATNGGLLLSPDEGDPEEAGVLDGARMAQQDWSRCRLAVLSACSTGTGEAKGPVNPESLVRGLLWAGVARVVASRWNLDTQSGVLFMDRFYTGVLSGKDAAAALQLAARRLREDQATSHPYFWAGFQSFGTR